MRRRGFGSAMRHAAREIARIERARTQEQARLQAAQLRAARNAERQAKADAKEAARLHAEARLEEAEDLTCVVQDREAEILEILTTALKANPAIDPLAGLRTFAPNRFDEASWNSIAPHREDFIPKEPGFFARLLPGAAQRRERELVDADQRFRNAITEHEQSLAARSAALQSFERDEDARRLEIEEHNAAVRDFQRRLLDAEHSAVVDHYSLVIQQSLKGEADALSAEVGYAPDSRHLVVDLELPEIAVVPEESAFRYVKNGDRIDAIARPLAKRRALYSQLICRIVLKCIDTIFRGGPNSIIDCLSLNAMLDTINPATGQEVRICLISLRVTADVFQTLNLALVEPEQCLRSLKASVSRSPAELLPVKPIVELDMVDPRFVETADVMSSLDRRPNLMELSPTEFEGLITNLFATMGLDTRQTRPSRDGGVDCVAFDPRPVFGGKVVIQAKRYKNTVGVSAVRDLFGTVQNEGASKGILVTTSGYGKAAFEFAAGKPLELLDGGNLLHLLADHAGVDARIIMPDGWADLPIHGE